MWSGRRGVAKLLWHSDCRGVGTSTIFARERRGETESQSEQDVGRVEEDRAVAGFKRPNMSHKQ